VINKCKIETCNNPCWSKGLCKNHTPRKHLPKNGGGLTNRMSVISSKKSNFVHNDGYNQQLSEMKKFFMQYWMENKEHTCENCRTWLGPEPLTYMFDHVLEKSKYPELAFEPENIMYLCLTCHSKKTDGHMHNITTERINYLKTKYNLQ